MKIQDNKEKRETANAEKTKPENNANSQNNNEQKEAFEVRSLASSVEGVRRAYESYEGRSMKLRPKFTSPVFLGAIIGLCFALIMEASFFAVLYFAFAALVVINAVNHFRLLRLRREVNTYLTWLLRIQERYEKNILEPLVKRSPHESLRDHAALALVLSKREGMNVSESDAKRLVALHQERKYVDRFREEIRARPRPTLEALATIYRRVKSKNDDQVHRISINSFAATTRQVFLLAAQLEGIDVDENSFAHALKKHDQKYSIEQPRAASEPPNLIEPVFDETEDITLTHEAEEVIRRFLKQYPASSVWHVQLNQLRTALIQEMDRELTIKQVEQLMDDYEMLERAIAYQKILAEKPFSYAALAQALIEGSRITRKQLHLPIVGELISEAVYVGRRMKRKVNPEKLRSEIARALDEGEITTFERRLLEKRDVPSGRSS